MGCLTVALAPSTPPGVAHDYTRQALASVRSGATLVSQLMKFGRKERLHQSPLSIDLAIKACGALLQRLLGPHIRLRIEAGAPGAKILADAIQIEQILMNLAANARDAMPEGGELMIRTRELPAGSDAGQRVLLEVRDAGCGMPREAQLRAFEPFFSTKGSGKGTGLGLSTVQAVTRALGGQVHLESEPQQGTTFTFHFPVLCTPNAQAASVPAESQFRGRALLVEDDVWVRVSVRKFLQDLGLDVLEASTAEEAVSRSSGELDLLVSDVVLPNVSGPRIRTMLQAQHPDLKTLYISAHPAYHLIERGLLEKGDALLQKPFERDALAARLTELLSKQRVPELKVTRRTRVAGFRCAQ
jgi:two-component system cell cycle sensor histidine kinase/response regulator CckA